MIAVWPLLTRRSALEKRIADLEGQLARLAGAEKDCLARETHLAHLVEKAMGSMVAFDAEQRERSAAETKLRRLNAELETRASTQNETLGRTLAELHEFTHTLSHDLRAPLRAIDGFTSVAIENHGEGLHPEALRLLRKASDNVHHMTRLIDGLLEFSRLGRTPVQRASIDMGELVQSVIAELRPTDREVAFVSMELPHVSGDAEMLQLAWRHLIANALKFTGAREGARIEISSREGSAPIFTIRDNGVGFDSAYAGKLFAVFERLHAGQPYEGTGLGLALVRRVIELHGGRIWAEGAVDKGAAFSFHLG